MGMRRGGLCARQVAVAEAEQRTFAVRQQFEDNGRRAGRYGDALLRFPSPGVDQSARCIDLYELAAGNVSGNDLQAITAAATQVERRRLAHPTDDLAFVDEQLPNCCQLRIDHDLSLDHGVFSRHVHASSFPILRLLASRWRDARPRTPPETASARPALAAGRYRDAGCRPGAASPAPPL